MRKTEMNICGDEIEKREMIFEGGGGGIEKRFGMNIMRVDNVGWWFSGIVHCNPFCIGLICSPWGNLRRVHQERKKKDEARKSEVIQIRNEGRVYSEQSPEGRSVCLLGRRSLGGAR